MSITFSALHQAISGRFGVHDLLCPLCGPERRSPVNRVRKVLRVWHVSRGFVTYACARCGETGYARDQDAQRINASTLGRVSAELEERNRMAAAVRLRKALTLWRLRQPLLASIGEVYLREARAYRGPIPSTLGFLPARGDYPPAIIAAFGVPDEPEPGIIALPEHKITGVHLTRIAPDGRDRDRSEKAKIMIGFSRGSPIALAPWTDGQALIITEGIEDALTAHETTGLAAWASGSASRMPAIAEAVPHWIECITIVADNDNAGRQHASALASALRGRNNQIRLIVLGAIAA